MLIEVDIGHKIPATLPIAISKKIVDVEGRDGYRSHKSHYSSHNQGEHGRLLNFQEILVDLYLGPRPASLPPKEDIVGVMVQDMEVVLKRSTTRTCSMLDKVLVVLVEMDIGIRPDLLPIIIQVIILDHLVL